MTNAIKPTKITFKKTEAEWYNYYNTLKEIARLREEIMNPHNDEPDENYGGGVSSVRVPGDPTAKMATRLMTSKQLSYLAEVVDAIERVYNALPDRYKELVRIRYWSKNNELNWDGVSLKLNISRRRAINWRDEIIYATVELLGWR